jgi:hypothetical protein
VVDKTSSDLECTLPRSNEQQAARVKGALFKNLLVVLCAMTILFVTSKILDFRSARYNNSSTSAKKRRKRGRHGASSRRRRISGVSTSQNDVVSYFSANLKRQIFFFLITIASLLYVSSVDPINGQIESRQDRVSKSMDKTSFTEDEVSSPHELLRFLFLHLSC